MKKKRKLCIQKYNDWYDFELTNEINLIVFERINMKKIRRIHYRWNYR